MTDGMHTAVCQECGEVPSLDLIGDDDHGVSCACQQPGKTPVGRYVDVYGDLPDRWSEGDDVDE